jgi:arylsulfatase A-like enzyme
MSLTRREYLSVMTAAVVPPPDPRPNIVLMLTDQQSISAMSAAGNPHLRTPHMDSLAREGTSFANSWCASPVCSPARSSILTGCFPTRTGVIYNGSPWNSSVPSVSEVFRDAGYDTAWCGKWHLPQGFPGAQGVPESRGFEFLPWKVSQTSQLAFGDFTDEPIAHSAADFIRGHSGKPFLLGVSLQNPHDICYQVMEKLPPGHPARAESDIPVDRLPPLPRNHDSSVEEPELIRICRDRKYYGEENTYTRDWDEIRWRRYLYAYYRMTERVDRSIGTVLTALRNRGLDDNTIVILSSDHGEGLAAHRWVVKLMLWQEVLSVPLIFRWPGRIKRGRLDTRTLASGVDIAPTLCELAKVRPPTGMHGVSLAGVLREGKPGTRDSVFSQLAPDTKNHQLQARAVRSARYKYAHFSTGANPELLFDLDSDPGEMRNLTGDPAHREVLKIHREMLQMWKRRTERSEGTKDA